jgi:hypothetical protein
MARFPNWATPIRRLILARLATQYLDKPGWRLDLETGEVFHPEFSRKAEELIEYWKADDRETRRLERELERLELHFVNERRPRRSIFDKEVFYSTQPLYYLEGFGVSALDFKPIAKVRLASSSLRLFIDLSDALRPLSKNARRKALRHGKLGERVSEAISRAVKRHLGG